MGGMSRTKGKVGERELAALLRAYGFDARRGQQFKGTSESPDVVGVPFYHIECKRTERLNIYEAFDQACLDCPPDLTPLVAHRRNKREWLAVLRFEDLIQLIALATATDSGKAPPHAQKIVPLESDSGKALG